MSPRGAMFFGAAGAAAAALALGACSVFGSENEPSSPDPADSGTGSMDALGGDALDGEASAIGVDASEEGGLIPPGSLLVFVSQAQLDVSSAGMPTRAAKACTDEGNAAGFAGMYQPWLGITGISPVDLLPMTGDWFRADGTHIGNRTTLVTAAVPAAIDRYANGGIVAMPVNVFTGIDMAGQVGSNCMNWTTTDAKVILGNAQQGGGGWTEQLVATSCTMSARVYCFQVQKR